MKRERLFTIELYPNYYGRDELAEKFLALEDAIGQAQSIIKTLYDEFEGNIVPTCDDEDEIFHYFKTDCETFIANIEERMLAERDRRELVNEEEKEKEMSDYQFMKELSRYERRL